MPGQLKVGGNIIASHTGVEGAGTVTLGNVVLGDSAVPTNNYTFRNKIINGDMRIDQRNAGSSITPASGQYTVDRWIYEAVQPSKIACQQVTTAPSGFVNSFKCTSLSAFSVGAGDVFQIMQRIEGYNISKLAWGTASASTVTLSFKVYSSLTGTFAGFLKNSANDRSYAFTYNIPVADTWTDISVTIPGDTTGTWLTANGYGLGVAWSLGCGSVYQAIPGSWNSGFSRGVSGQVDIVATNGATLYITGVQLEEGSVATPFEHRPYGLELSLCQRYYEVCSGVVTANQSNSPILYKVPKRGATLIKNWKAENSVTNNVIANLPAGQVGSGATEQGGFTIGTLGAYYSGAPSASAVISFGAESEL